MSQSSVKALLTERPDLVCEFGPFRIDRAAGRLLRDGHPVPLTPKAFDVLLALVESHGRLVEKDELMNRVWADSFVEEGNLKVTISMLRKALEEGTNGHRYIETVPRRGYRFAADVKEFLDDGRALVVREVSKSSITIEQEESSLPASARAVSNARHLVTEIKLHIRGVAMALIGIAAAIASVGIWLHSTSARKPAALFQVGKVAQLTTKGMTRIAAISPDGKLFAYSDQRERGSLWLGHVDGGEALQIHAPVDGIFLSLTFSPDGSSLYYTLTDNLLPVSQFSSTGALYKLPVFGGAPEKVRDNVRNSISFSPDGNQFAFVRNEQGSSKTSLVVADTHGPVEHEIAWSSGKHGFAWHSPSWAPDGQSIALGAPINDNDSENEVLLVNVASGAARTLTKYGWSGIESMIWRHDGNGLIVVARDKNSDLWQLWGVSYPDGDARRIVTDLSTYGYALSMSVDDNSLLVTQNQIQSDIWVAPAGNLSEARQITFSSLGRWNGFNALHWTPDGRIIYTAQAAESSTLWMMNADGSEQKQLIPAGGSNFSPSATDDGHVVFQSNRSGKYAVWRANLDGSDMRQLTDIDVATAPNVSPDGKWIVYESSDDDLGELYRMSIDGGEPRLLTHNRAGWGRISPDSKFVACSYESDGKVKIAILPIEGGEPLRVFDVPRLANLRSALSWTPDGKAVCYRDWNNGIWRQDVEGGQPERLAGLPEERLQGYGWSRDGKYFAFARAIGSKDAFLITNAK